jgi:hypothetical protein
VAYHPVLSPSPRDGSLEALWLAASEPAQASFQHHHAHHDHHHANEVSSALSGSVSVSGFIQCPSSMFHSMSVFSVVSFHVGLQSMCVLSVAAGAHAKHSCQSPPSMPLMSVTVLMFVTVCTPCGHMELCDRLQGQQWPWGHVATLASLAMSPLWHLLLTQLTGLWHLADTAQACTCIHAARRGAPPPQP